MSFEKRIYAVCDAGIKGLDQLGIKKHRRCMETIHIEGAHGKLPGYSLGWS